MSDAITTMEAGEKSLVPQQIAAQAKARPEAVALAAGSTTGSTKLTYAELDRRARAIGALAQYCRLGSRKITGSGLSIAARSMV